MTDNKHPHTVLVYGGNGYVGSRVVEFACKTGAHCISVSRSGLAPAHLLATNPSWLAQVSWLVGDAAKPDPDLIASADVVICLVGSPPVPTFSQAAFDQQLAMNGVCNSEPIRAAQAAGVSRVVLLSAHIPSLLCSDKFAYYLGKQQAMEAAHAYAGASADHSVTVLRPSAIYGTRHTRSGRPVPLGLLMAPISWVMKFMPHALTRILPESPVALDKVAEAIVKAAMGQKQHGLTLIENQQLVNDALQ